MRGIAHSCFGQNDGTIAMGARLPTDHAAARSAVMTDLLARGKTWWVIGRSLKMSARAAFAWAKRNGVCDAVPDRDRRVRWRQTEVRALVIGYDGGLLDSRIACLLNRTPDAIRSKIRWMRGQSLLE